MNRSTRMFIGSLASVGALTLASSVAYASNQQASWAKVDVSQSQSVWSAKPVDLAQSATSVAWTTLGDEASAKSKNAATQGVWGAGKATQNQKVSSAASLTWQKNVFPAEVTARTSGGVWQDQSAWGRNMKAEQAAATWQGSRVFKNETVIDGVSAESVAGVDGDLVQRQDIIGATQTQGFANPPFPHVAVLFGGKLLTNVQVFVQSLLTF